MCVSYRIPSELIDANPGLQRKGIDAAQDGDARLAEDVGDFGFFQAGSVVFELQPVLQFVDVEAAQAVGVGEEGEMAELVGLERGLEFVGDFDEGHDGRIIAA